MSTHLQSGLVPANGVNLAFDAQGDGEPLLMIMGLGGQLTDWHPDLIELLAEHYTVIRFDNRDIGLSTYCDAPAPSRWDLVKANLRPGSVSLPYSIADMADDAAGLLDALGYDRAHVLGMSMGGMIAQELTIRHPDKVASLCSVMSNTGDLRNGRPTLRVLRAMAKRGEPDRTEALDIAVAFLGLIGGPDWDEAGQRSRTAASLERAYNPAGVLRQSQAIAATPNRTKHLGAITQPTVVIHGLADPLVPPSGGIATARAIPDSRLVMYPRMGHDLPKTRHSEIVAEVRTNTARTSPTR